jgi:hypothetical protein
VTVSSEPRSLKSTTDRIRRLPRLKGWNAVTVKVEATDEKVAVLAVTSTGTTATPWPKKEQPTTAPAPAMRARVRKATAA